MRRVRAPHRIVSLGLVVSVLGIGASCGGTQGSGSVAVTAGPSATASTTGAQAAAPTATAAAKPKELAMAAWTDDAVIQALARDCRWDPDGCIRLMEKNAPQSYDQIGFLPEGMKLDPSDPRELPPEACQTYLPLACAAVPEQSCAGDECAQSHYDCVPACDKTCSDCAGKCVTSCESCKSGCSDDACRLACARSCAGCRQACVQALDHCATAECNEQAKRCFEKRDALWAKTACPKVCPRVEACIEKCPKREDDYGFEFYREACAKGCFKRLGTGCPASFETICSGHPNASYAFWTWHRSHHPEE